MTKGENNNVTQQGRKVNIRECIRLDRINAERKIESLEGAAELNQGKHVR